MPIIKPSDDLCASLSAIGLPAWQHNRRSLRSIVHRSSGRPPDEHVTANELANRVLELHRAGRLVLEPE